MLRKRIERSVRQGHVNIHCMYALESSLILLKSVACDRSKTAKYNFSWGWDVSIFLHTELNGLLRKMLMTKLNRP